MVRCAVLAVAVAALVIGCAADRSVATGSIAPDPSAESSTTPTVHRGPAATCPRHDPALSDTAIPTELRSDDQLAPPDPVGGLLCRYVPLNRPSPAGGIARSVPLTAGQATTLAALTDAGDLAPTGSYACPNSEGAEDVAIFQLSDGSARRVDYALDGCSWATNGVLRRWIGTDLRRELTRLIGDPAPPSYPTSPG